MTDRKIPIGDTVIIGGQTGTVRDYMDAEGLPHVAVVEMHGPIIPEHGMWQCLDTTAFELRKVEPS